jgi:DNA-directed RNA polymerase subunit F
MIGKKVIETEPITIAEAKQMLEQSSDSYDPTYEQNLAIEHVNKFTKLDVEKAQELVKELEEIIKKTQAIKIADLMPADLADLRLMFAKERGSHKKEELEQILEIVNKYRE